MQARNIRLKINNKQRKRSTEKTVKSLAFSWLLLCIFIKYIRALSLQGFVTIATISVKLSVSALEKHLSNEAKLFYFWLHWVSFRIILLLNQLFHRSFRIFKKIISEFCSKLFSLNKIYEWFLKYWQDLKIMLGLFFFLYAEIFRKIIFSKKYNDLFVVMVVHLSFFWFYQPFLLFFFSKSVFTFWSFSDQ